MPLVTTVPMQTDTYFEQLMTHIEHLPLWVKQVVYAQLQRELESRFTKSTLTAFDPDNILQLAILPMTPKGQKLATDTNSHNASPLVHLLQHSQQGKNIVSTCLIMNWNLEECCQTILEAQAQGCAEPFESPVMQATVEFIGNKIRMGEYLVRIQRIQPQQLQQALQVQQYIEASMGQKTGIASVLINLGYVHKQDTEGILFLKEESKKRFQVAPQPTEAVSA
jgi:hypothetical protein